jgi:hypothetical protein
VADSTDAGAQPGAQISDGSGQISDGS